MANIFLVARGLLQRGFLAMRFPYYPQCAKIAKKQYITMSEISLLPLQVGPMLVLGQHQGHWPKRLADFCKG